jgi:hypothetical protein
MTHGCCGKCCHEKTFPGNVLNSIIATFEKYCEIDKIEYLYDIDEFIVGSLRLIYDAYYEKRSGTVVFRMIELSEYLWNKDEQWHKDFLHKAEFAYWSLRAVMGEYCEDIHSSVFN